MKSSRGYLSTKNGPKLSNEKLEHIRKRVTGIANEFDTSFHGDPTDQNLFARIVRGELPQWRLWEDATHVAFLTPFANTPGYTVLVPRTHLSSDIFNLEDQQYTRLIDAACSVAAILKEALRSDLCGMFFEGFEIDYAHVKLVPVISRVQRDSQRGPQLEDFHDRYEGFISTRLGPATDDLDQVHIMARKMQSLL